MMLQSIKILLVMTGAVLLTACGQSYGDKATSPQMENDFGTFVRGDSCYRGQLKGGIPNGEGVMELKGDSLEYRGQWKNGRHQGKGVLRNANGTIWEGIWDADTLTFGQRTDSTGCYQGGFGRDLQPLGYGTFVDGRQQESYEGQWQKGQPTGFGLGIDAERGVQVGWWKAGKFVGERMKYTTARVYGIDISHYQHGGRPKRRYGRYPINWKSLRITSLGANNKNSVGNVDYPVSFCYIKSTQGVRLNNPHYVADSRSARAQGIQVGAYHFMDPIDGTAQARWFLSRTQIAKKDLPPMLDVELSKKQIAKMGGDSVMFREMLEWLHLVEKQTGKKPILYLSQTFVNTYFPKAPAELKTYLVWIARYSEYRPYVQLLYWQLTPFGRVKGIRGEVDINVFNGSQEQFRRYVENGFVFAP